MSEMKQWVIDGMEPIGACMSAIDKANKYDNPQLAWDNWDDGSELLWTIIRIKYDRPTLIQCVCEIAGHVLETYEKKYPGDDRPRKAIEAARKVAEDDTEENRAAADAACAAYIAARVADVADDAHDERAWQADCVRRYFPRSPFLMELAK